MENALIHTLHIRKMPCLEEQLIQTFQKITNQLIHAFYILYQEMFLESYIHIKTEVTNSLPRNELDEVSVECNSSFGVKRGAVSSGGEVLGDNLILCV